MLPRLGVVAEVHLYSLWEGDIGVSLGPPHSQVWVQWGLLHVQKYLGPEPASVQVAEPGIGQM